MTLDPAETLGVRDDCLAVTWQSSHVRIDPGAVDALVRDLAGRAEGKLRIAAPAWDTDLHWHGDSDRTANYILVLDALNFCFWGDPKWRISFRGQTLNGYWALAGSLTRAIEEGFDLTDPEVMVHATRTDLANVFRGENAIPLLDARVAHLNEAGRILLDRYAGRFAVAVQECRRSAVRMVRTLAGSFWSFNDVATYRGHTIKLYKRAQILVVDLMAALPDAAWTRFVDLRELTAFADYKVPQVLREKGVLQYSADLADRIERFVEIPAGSEEEVELRAATVVAVHDVASGLRERGLAAREADLDGVLWHLGQDMRFAHPYHRTRTVFY